MAISLSDTDTDSDTRPARRQRPDAAARQETVKREAPETIQVGPAAFELWRQPANPDGRICIVARPRSQRRLRAAASLACPIVQCGLETLSTLRTTTDQMMAGLCEQVDLLREARQVAVVGDSGGGYAAFMLGTALARLLAPCPVRVIAFNPPTRIWPPDPKRMEGAYLTLLERVGRHPELLRRLVAEGDLVPRLQALAERPGVDFRGLVVAAAGNPRDRDHAERLRGLPGVELALFDTGGHAAFTWWLDVPVAPAEQLREFVVARRQAHAERLAKLRPGSAEEEEDEIAPRLVSPADKEAVEQRRIEREVAALQAFQARYPSLPAMFASLEDTAGHRA